jgi:hypothetical protein
MSREVLATTAIGGKEFNVVGCEFVDHHTGEMHCSVALQGLGKDTVFSSRKWLALMACQKEITQFFIKMGHIGGEENSPA